MTRITAKETIVSKPEDHLSQAIQLALDNVQTRKGRPFGAVLVKDGQVVATGVNTVLSSHDPTAHAELQAIREAARAQGSPRLDGHVMYASGHPCPMCLAAMYLAGIRQVCYAYSNEDGEPYGLSTRELYAELAKPLAAQAMQLSYLPLRPAGQEPYEAWRQLNTAPLANS
ncbi:nucleoside deaminase [Noviherbaspirillum cavernae]|uniref:Nucleoside deaminase n=1 Tax=Noviherbaspirillum cavernae TaxID=2320862 RepID=A0A418X4W1_9BURK|nr:nucleoside deaminase [Noviherbaspirillum cavernae]RJG07456.1 nucleoside deaminase [Noviherbaspirillum cavernae]